MSHQVGIFITLRIIGPSKLAILRTLTLRHTGSNLSIGGSKILREWHKSLYNWVVFDPLYIHWTPRDFCFIAHLTQLVFFRTKKVEKTFESGKKRVATHGTFFLDRPDFQPGKQHVCIYNLLYICLCLYSTVTPACSISVRGFNFVSLTIP